MKFAGLLKLRILLELTINNMMINKYHEIPLSISGAKMMYLLDPSMQDKAIAVATNLSEDLSGRSIQVFTLLIFLSYTLTQLIAVSWWGSW